MLLHLMLKICWSYVSILKIICVFGLNAIIVEAYSRMLIKMLVADPVRARMLKSYKCLWKEIDFFKLLEVLKYDFYEKSEN